VQLAIDTSSNSLVTVTFVERGRDFCGDAVKNMLVAQRLFGEHPHLLKMQVGRAHGHAPQVSRPVAFACVLHDFHMRIAADVAQPTTAAVPDRHHAACSQTLSHPMISRPKNMESVQDVFLTPGFLAIASEYADLGSLRDYMDRCSRQVVALRNMALCTCHAAHVGPWWCAVIAFLRGAGAGVTLLRYSQCQHLNKVP